MATRLELGHVQVHDPDYPKRRALRYTLHDASARLPAIAGPRQSRQIWVAALGGAWPMLPFLVDAALTHRKNLRDELIAITRMLLRESPPVKGDLPAPEAKATPEKAADAKK